MPAINFPSNLKRGDTRLIPLLLTTGEQQTRVLVADVIAAVECTNRP
jgi:hypothetical protein